MKRVDKVLPEVMAGNKVPGSKQLQEKSLATPSAGAGNRHGRDHVDAINQVFAELALAYHNQFHKAYGQEGALVLAKKYWLGVLGEYSPEVILRAVRQVVRTSEFLPSLAAIVSACENAYTLFGLPTAQAAYVEACCAPEPKREYKWSHPAVYLAAAATGWFALANETQAQIFPLFAYNYARYCHRVLTGEILDLPVPLALPETVAAPLSPEENLVRLKQLRKQFGL
jgi:hypothetical protein